MDMIHITEQLWSMTRPKNKGLAVLRREVVKEVPTQQPPQPSSTDRKPGTDTWKLDRQGRAEDFARSGLPPPKNVFLLLNKCYPSLKQNLWEVDH